MKVTLTVVYLSKDNAYLTASHRAHQIRWNTLPDGSLNITAYNSKLHATWCAVYRNWISADLTIPRGYKPPRRAPKQ